MGLLIAGFVLFLGAHLTPGVIGQRERLVGWFGEGRFLGIYIALSVLGMLLIGAGLAVAPYVHIWSPPVWGYQAALGLVALGFVLFVGLLLPTNIRRLTRHPMLWGISAWALGHLLANGDLASIIVFAGFGGYALLSIWSLNRRGAQMRTTKYPLWQDALALATAVSAYAVILWAHPLLFGVAVPLP